MGEISVELDPDLVDLEELGRPAREVARELIVLGLYAQGEISSGEQRSCSAWRVTSSFGTRQSEVLRTSS